MDNFFRHREVATHLLSGYGLEIGALHNPSAVPNNCITEYLDIKSKEELHCIFPELNKEQIVDNKYIGDINSDNIYSLTGKTFDYIIINHVLEHTPNPIQVLENILKGLKDEGYLILSIPDKNYSYDIKRNLTTFEHLLADYYRGIDSVNDDHYIDFIQSVHPDAFADKKRFINILKSVKERREHVHVWDSNSFRNHLLKIFEFFNLKVQIVFESMAEDNNFEYFAVLKKSNDVNLEEIAMKMLFAVYDTRPDLQNAFNGVRDKIIKWAYDCGCVSDSDKYILKYYKKFYRNSKSISKL